MVSERKGPQVQLMSCPDSWHGQQCVPHGLKPHTSGGTCRQHTPCLLPGPFLPQGSSPPPPPTLYPLTINPPQFTLCLSPPSSNRPQGPGLLPTLSSDKRGGSEPERDQRGPLTGSSSI